MSNRLAGETSPYLLQHADNPVDWYPWGAAAFRRARAEEKPVLLSVGYSACHWCHVMERESFEDPAIAGIMNELFVNVKVDREERPDVDAIYMEAVQAMTRRGGWPMTVWLTPEGRPFYAGTYFPARDHPGMPSFSRVMQAVAEAWRERREGVEEQAARLTSAVSQALPPSDDVPARQALEQAYLALHRSFDSGHGGFGPAPKFPQAPSLEFLLRISGEEWAPEAAPMLRLTLDAMARGGIYDHLGGGFARYAVDQTWLIPHFEKMLYDNAQLARLYLRAWQETGEPRWRRVAVETLEYVLRDLGHPEGGFFAAEDADSEGEEGRFYVWSRDEFMEIAGPEDGPVAADHFGVTATGNFEGRNHLYEAAPVDQVAAGRGAPVAEIGDAVARAAERLLEARGSRVRPALDHKVITSWNGLALRAFAEAGAVLAEPRYLEAARRNARFVLAHLRRADGRLLRSWSKGRADIPGFLDDHASYALGLLALYQASGEVEWFREGRALIEQMVALFTDPAGGFFSTGADAEELITRPKDQMDNPLPSGNSLAAEALLVLSLYTGDAEMRRLAENAIRAGGRLIDSYPAAVGHLLGVLHALHAGPKEVAVVGPEAAELGRVVWERFRPHIALAVDRDGADAAHVPLLAGRAKGAETLAYVCEQFACRAPVSDPAALRAQL